MRRPYLTDIKSTKKLQEILNNNPGIVILKFGAAWCGPCKVIEPRVFEWLNHMPETAQSVILDIDESFEIYSFMKNKRMVNGIPAILCYYRGNFSYIPDDSVLGAKPTEVELFFQRCYNKAIQQQRTNSPGPGPGPGPGSDQLQNN